MSVSFDRHLIILVLPSRSPFPNCKKKSLCLLIHAQRDVMFFSKTPFSSVIWILIEISKKRQKNCLNTHTHTHTHTPTPTHTHPHTHTHTHTHAHTHTHTHTPSAIKFDRPWWSQTRGADTWCSCRFIRMSVLLESSPRLWFFCFKYWRWPWIVISIIIITFIITIFFISMVRQSLLGQGLLIVEGSRLLSLTRLSVGLLWTSDHP